MRQIFWQRIVKTPMSNVPKKPVKPKTKDLSVKFQPELIAETKEKPKRASRAKPKPTKEEVIKMLTDSSNELKQIIQDLKEEDGKIQGLGLKRVGELVKETINNLEEDQKEIDEECKELSSIPEDK